MECGEMLKRLGGKLASDVHTRVNKLPAVLFPQAGSNFLRNKTSCGLFCTSDESELEPPPGIVGAENQSGRHDLQN
jgi:hypothetical protein